MITAYKVGRLGNILAYIIIRFSKRPITQLKKS
jgi:hypothetical protein